MNLTIRKGNIHKADIELIQDTHLGEVPYGPEAKGVCSAFNPYTSRCSPAEVL
jgi:hypothetical protein